MAVASMRLLTRISFHIDGADLVYEANEVADLDDAVLDLVARDLAILEV